MKFEFKKFLMILSLIISFNLYAVESTNGILDYKAGDDVYSPVTGIISQIGSKNIPKVFGSDCIVIDFQFDYKYKNEKKNVTYQLIISGVKSYYKAGEKIAYERVLGKATDKQKLVNVRCKNFDPYLASIASVKPVVKDGWYYFGISIFMSNSFKVLDYPLAENKKFIVEFPDYPESLEELYKNTSEPGPDGKKIELDLFSFFNICLKTKLNSYPVPVKQFSASDKFSEALVQKKYFSGCTHIIETTFDSLPVRFYFQDKYYDYLKEEYKTGDDIYLYCTAVCILKDQIVFYVRDFTLESPDEYVEKRIKELKNE